MGSLQITLACDLGGITLYHPTRPAPDGAHMFLLIDDPRPETHEDTTIYWQELTEAAQTIPGLMRTYEYWKMWIQVMGEYNELIDPLHCTLQVTHEQDLPYDEPWAQAVCQWYPTDNKYLYRSLNAEFWRISSRTTDKTIGKKVEGNRTVIKEDSAGRDCSEDPEVTNMLARIAETVWAKGPYDRTDEEPSGTT
ncbi:unnamed protein product [Boreogadus saida]